GIIGNQMIKIRSVGRFGHIHFDPLGIAELRGLWRLSGNHRLHDRWISCHNRRINVQNQRRNCDLGWGIDQLSDVLWIGNQPVIYRLAWSFRQADAEMLTSAVGISGQPLRWDSTLPARMACSRRNRCLRLQRRNGELTVSIGASVANFDALARAVIKVLNYRIAVLFVGPPEFV